MKSKANFTPEELAALSPNDRAEVMKFTRYLKLTQTRRGQRFLKTQEYWRTYLGLSKEEQSKLTF